LSAIVGEPEEEGAAPQEHGQPPTGTLLLDGAMPVDEIKARLDLPNLPAEGDYHTLGGLLLALLKRLPRVGDRIVFGGWRFEVLEMDGRRVSRVGVQREPAAESEG